MKLCQERRGIYVNQMFMQNNRVEISYELPMAGVVFDFYDRLKSGTVLCIFRLSLSSTGQVGWCVWISY